jgi:hypothetical protein
MSCRCEPGKRKDIKCLKGKDGVEARKLDVAGSP